MGVDLDEDNQDVDLVDELKKQPINPKKLKWQEDA